MTVKYLPPVILLLALAVAGCGASATRLDKAQVGSSGWQGLGYSASASPSPSPTGDPICTRFENDLSAFISAVGSRTRVPGGGFQVNLGAYAQNGGWLNLSADASGKWKTFAHQMGRLSYLEMSGPDAQQSSQLADDLGAASLATLDAALLPHTFTDSNTGLTYPQAAASDIASVQGDCNLED